MAATSKHYGDIAIWVEKVINSSETYQQCISARRLIYAFESMSGKYTKVDYSHKTNLLIGLRAALQNKFKDTRLKYLNENNISRP